MTTITKTSFGKTSNGKAVFKFTLKNSQNAEVDIISYGGTITSIIVPDKNGKLGDVALGYDNIEAQERKAGYVGALIGRYGNRIEASTFELNGKVYNLYANDRRNHLHGGLVGYDKAVWDYEIIGDKLVLTHRSPDGEEGYPGNLKITVVYTFSDKNELKIDYTAVSDADTVCNLTNHAYFNLGGHNSGTILNHKLKLHAKNYTVSDAESLPNGEIAAVSGTPLDFTDFHVIGERIDDEFTQLIDAKGYDHNWVIDDSDDRTKLRLAAELVDETTGRVMNTYTDLPGVQFYSGNFLGESSVIGKEGTTYGKRAGLCLETQFYPNSMKHKNFPSPVLKANEMYHHVTVYEFKVK